MLFKKQISAFLILSLLISQLGVSFNVHFCADSISSISVNSNDYTIEKNCCGEVEKDSKCCHNKIIKSVEKSDVIFTKQLSFSTEFIFTNTPWEPIVIQQKKYFETKQNDSYFHESNAPPNYKLYCQYTFYG